MLYIVGFHSTSIDVGECFSMFTIEYHAVGNTWWQPLLSYDKWCFELKIGLFIY